MIFRSFYNTEFDIDVNNATVESVCSIATGTARAIYTIANLNDTSINLTDISANCTLVSDTGMKSDERELMLDMHM
jgi:hypothetical protein